MVLTPKDVNDTIAGLEKVRDEQLRKARGNY